MHDDEIRDEWVEKPLLEWEGKPLKAAAVCPVCKRALLMKKFTRPMTPAEAQYRGYSGMRKIEMVTHKCEDCRAPRRSHPSEFTAAELQYKAQRGEISPVVANAFIKQKREESFQRMAAARQRRKDTRIMAEWDAIIEPLNMEIESLGQQQKYARTKRDRPKVLDYVTGYREILVKMRSELRLERRKATKRPAHEMWQQFLTTYERNIIATLWNDIEFKYRNAGMRPPMAFAQYRNVDPTPASVPVVRHPMANTAAQPAHSGQKPAVNDWNDL